MSGTRKISATAGASQPLLAIVLTACGTSHTGAGSTSSPSATASPNAQLLFGVLLAGDQPYVSLQFHEGSGANLPWMQELPDPASSSIWGLPVEIDPKTAASLGVESGDIVRVESPHGSLQAPVYVHPGAVPQVVSLGVGDGHTHYGRYASGRGANPLSILSPSLRFIHSS